MGQPETALHLKMEKTIEIDWHGEKKSVRIKRISFGDMNEIKEKSMNVQAINSQPVVKMNQKVFIELSLLKGIIDAPFTVDLISIQNLDNEVGMKLYEEFVELNQLTEKKN
jgi:hypothetical protein